MKVELEVKTFGEYLKYKMLLNSLSYRDVAPLIGTSISTISRMINNKPFEIKWIIPVAEWCGITPAQLWGLLEAYKNK